MGARFRGPPDRPTPTSRPTAEYTNDEIVWSGGKKNEKNIPHSTKGVFCRGKPFRNIKQTSRFESQFNACSMLVPSWCMKSNGYDAAWTWPTLPLVFCTKGQPMSFKAHLTSTSWRLGRNMAKRTCTNLKHGEWWPESLAKKQIKNILTSFFATCKVLACRMENDGSWQHHVHKAPYLFKKIKVCYGLFCLNRPRKNRRFSRWSYCSRITQLFAANPLCTLVRISSQEAFGKVFQVNSTSYLHIERI